MPLTIPEKPISRVALVLSVFVAASALMAFGVIIGWQTDEMTTMFSAFGWNGNASAGGPGAAAAGVGSAFKAFETVILLALVVTILVVWTLFLVIRTSISRHQLNLARKKLEVEVRRQQRTNDELHITHQQLAATSGQLGGILEGTTDLIAAIDNDLNYISFNEAYHDNIRQLFGTDIVVGMNVREALHTVPDKMEGAIELWKDALKGSKFSATQEFAHRNGTHYYYELSYTPIFDAGGEVIGAAQISRDVTERKTTEQKLRREMDFVSAAIDVNSSLVIVLDLDGKVVRFNQACEKLTGYSFEEVKGRVFWNVLIPTQDVAKIKASYKDFDSTFFSEDYINRWVTKDEIVKVISWQVSPIRDDEGEIMFIVGTGIDISEKREIETARNRMLKILENSPDFIGIYDFQGKLTYLNPAGRKLVGLDDATDISRFRTASFHPDWVNDAIQAEAIPSAVKSGSWLGTTALKTTEDTEIPISHLIIAHQGSEGKIEYFSTVIRDISTQKKMEERLARARDEAIQTIRSKSEFLANMSHEIRTPMSGIIGISDLLLETELDPEQQDFAQTIQKCGEALLTIINDILDFSKLEAGKMKFEQADFDLQETVDSVVEMFTSTIYRKGLELSVLLGPEVPTRLRGDSGRLRQVLTNLVSNAVKFTDRGEIVIRITMVEDVNEPLLRFSVTDTGVGIAQDAGDALFLPYSQIKSRASENYSGTGLGLAICKQIVEMMGGGIGFESKPGKGSKFWFTARIARQPESEASAAPLVLKNKRILIVDDNDTNRNVLLHQARSWGMIPDETDSGRNALKMLKTAARNREHFDVVVIDSSMPEMDGSELTAKIKSEPLLRRTRIVQMPSAADHASMSSARSEGEGLVVSKPLRLTSLQEVLVSALSAKNDLREQENGHGLTEYERITLELELDIESGEGSSRILIAEDNLVNQKVIFNQVRKLGYPVDLVENGEEALQALKSNSYSLVLMDCEMPVMDGYEATAEIRLLEASGMPRIPIVAVTAHALAGDREKCIEAGMDDYITKPTRQKTLAETIAKWIGESPVSASKLVLNGAVVGSAESVQGESGSIRARLDELGEACGTDVVCECIDLFLSDSFKVIGILRSALERGDLHGAAVEAHKLKGSAANMGAVSLPDLCQELIVSAKENDRETSKLAFERVSEEYDSIVPLYSEQRVLISRSEELVPSSA